MSTNMGARSRPSGRRLLVDVRWQVEHVDEGLLAVMQLAHPETELAQEPGVVAGPDERRLVRRHGHLEGRVDYVVGIFVIRVLEELGGGEKAAGANLETGHGSMSLRKAFQGSEDARTCLRMHGPGLEARAGQSLGDSIRSELILAGLRNQVVGSKKPKNAALCNGQ